MLPYILEFLVLWFYNEAKFVSVIVHIIIKGSYLTICELIKRKNYRLIQEYENTYKYREIDFADE